jgi:hypothetical protein
VKIYSNKEFSQLPEFSTKRTSSTRRFQKFVRTFLEPLETESKGVERRLNGASKEKEEQLAMLEGSTHARDKRAVTIPTV